MKNEYAGDTTLGWAYNFMHQGNPQAIVIPPMLVSVQEGDIIYLWYYTPNSNDSIGGGIYGNRTSLTIETVG